MKKDLLKLMTEIARAYTKQIKGNARTSILVVAQDTDEMLEINIDKVYDKITVTTVTGGKDVCSKN
jgi:hypothetical protein